MSLKQREIKFKPRIKLNHNTYKQCLPTDGETEIWNYYRYYYLENCCFLSMAAIVELACVTGRISRWALLFFGGGVARRLGYMYLSDDSTSDYPLVGWLKQQNKILPHISTHGGNVVLPAHGGSDLP